MSKGCPPERDPDRAIAGPLFPVHERSVEREIVILHRLYLWKGEAFLAIRVLSYRILPRI